jgi:hypothetical protein
VWSNGILIQNTDKIFEFFNELDTYLVKETKNIYIIVPLLSNEVIIWLNYQLLQ